MKNSDLLKALQVTIPGTGSNSLMFFGNCVVSIGDGISITYPLETGINFAIAAGDLLKAVPKMGDELTLKVQNDILLVSDSKAKLRLKPFGADEKMGGGLAVQEGESAAGKLRDNVTALQGRIQEREWKDVPKKLSEAFELSLFSVGKDSLMGKISGVAIRGCDLLSTDNYRVSHYVMDSPVADEIFRLRTSTIQKMLTLGEFVSVSIDPKDDFLFLKTKDGVVVTATLLPESKQYPFDKVVGSFGVMKFNEATDYQELPEGLLKSIEIVEVMARESEFDYTTQITIEQLEDKSLRLVGEKATGEMEDVIVAWNGNLPVKIIGSPTFLKKILTKTRKFTISPIKKALLFEAPNFRYLMLARIL